MSCAGSEDALRMRHRLPSSLNVRILNLRLGSDSKCFGGRAWVSGRAGLKSPVRKKLGVPPTAILFNPEYFVGIGPHKSHVQNKSTRDGLESRFGIRIHRERLAV